MQTVLENRKLRILRSFSKMFPTVLAMLNVSLIIDGLANLAMKQVGQSEQDHKGHSNHQRQLRQLSEEEQETRCQSCKTFHGRKLRLFIIS